MRFIILVVQAVGKFVVGLFCGCTHSHQTRPFTLENETYKVCLDCGKRLYYSASEMRPLTSAETRRVQAASRRCDLVLAPNE